MKNKKNLIGRVTIDFPIEVIPEELIAYMSHLTTECNVFYVSYLCYLKNHSEVKFSEFFDGDKLKTGYIIDYLGCKPEASELFIDFCRFIANTSSLESDISYQADAHEDP